MLQKLFAWIKNNKLATALILVVAYLLAKNYLGSVSPIYKSRSNSLPIAGGGEMAAVYDQSAPAPEVTDRLVVQESNVSLVVDNVRQKVDEVLDYIGQKGGYMVSSSISQPQEAPFATVVVRLPSKELRPALEYLRKLGIKVTSEYLSGYDVTDQYVDIEARIAILFQTKAKFEEIINRAEKVDEILRVQQEIINVQTQIDNLKGRQDYLKKTAENARLTVYLSPDEWALPYAPEENVFRPKIIFKLAVRSLVNCLRGLGKLAIWIGVYSVIWLPALLAWRFFRRRR